MRLAPDRGEPHLLAADIHYRCYRDYEAALAELAIARRGLPNDPDVFALTGFIERRRGRWEQSISNFERAAELDPRNWFLLQQTAGAYQQLRRFSDSARTLDRALAALPGDANTRVARALVDLEWHADTQPGYDAIQDVVSADPSAVDEIAEQWFYLALCRRDFAEVTRALASVPPEGIIPVNVRMPRSFCEGLAARAQDDVATAERAFTAARDEMEAMLRGQPEFAEALCVLGMCDAALGRKEEALAEGRRATELCPVSKDAVLGAELLRNLAVIHAWSGEKDLALKQLEDVLQIPGPISYGQLRLFPWWDPLCDDPRFDKLVEQSKQPVALG